MGEIEGRIQGARLGEAFPQAEDRQTHPI